MYTAGFLCSDNDVSLSPQYEFPAILFCLKTLSDLFILKKKIMTSDNIPKKTTFTHNA